MSTCGPGLAPALEGLRPVDLDELVRRASLMHRTDRKYLVPASAAAHLVRTLDGSLDDGLRVLQIDGARSFGYRSTYLDTPEWDSFRGAATARRRRFKVRRRDYLDTGTAYLEVKTRTGRGEALKERMPIDSPASGWTPSPAERAFVAGRLVEAGLPLPRRPMHPVLATSYRRTTLLVADEGSRVTIDTGLAWHPVPLAPGQAGEAGTPAHASAARHTPTSAALQELVVVETKAGTRPGLADRVLWAAGHRPGRLSKYATGLTLVHDLPDHRWHRTARAVRADLHPAG